jgi:diguanylate cyclase (GGDEF)-like protein
VSSATSAVLAHGSHPDLTRVGRRAAASLVIVLLAALVGAGILLGRANRQQEQNRVEAHLGVALQAAVSEAGREATQAQQQASLLAADPTLQSALAAGNGKALERLTAAVPGAAAAPGNRLVAGTTRPSLRREVHVLVGGRVIGTVAVTVPLDGGTLAKLSAAAPLAPGEGLLFVRGERIIAGPHVLSTARVQPHAVSARIAGSDYRVAQTRLLGGPQGVRLAAFAPGWEVGRPVAHAERLLAVALGATFAALLLLARLLARPALVPLARLAREARSSAVDDLTKLTNRRAFTQAATAELARSRRSGRPLSIALVDIDDFKQVNDTFGHGTGDGVLRAVADVLRDHFREVDVAARIGGEEFAVLLPETDAAGAREAAERFVSALAAHEFGDGSTRPRRITASAGIASGAHGSVEELLERADRALYRAKERGKNRVALDAPAHLV